jgi:hypothetical protein
MTDEFPQMLRVRQQFDATPPVDVAASVADGFAAIRGQLKPGMRVAVGVGSRGISNLAKVVAAVIGELKSAGAEPFILPAMGSHGGATPEGQAGLLADYGVTEASMGVPVRASMEVGSLGQVKGGQDVPWSREALAADGVIVINRVKPHTDFAGPMGSGLTKMLVVGLGKHAGASAYHAAALTLGYEAALMRLAKVVFARARILGGVAIVENAMHDTARVEVLAADAIPRREPELCAEAATMMPALPFDEIDLLIVDQIGKNISGTGMDTNTIGRSVHGYILMPGDALAKPFIWRIFVRGLTPETHGNAIGIGLAEATTKRLVAGVDAAALRTNVLTSRAVQCAKLPMDFATDAEAIRAMLASLPDSDPAKARVVRIRDTLSLGTLEVSAALAAEVAAHPAVEPLGQAEPMQFGVDGNLSPLELY